MEQNIAKLNISLFDTIYNQINSDIDYKLIATIFSMLDKYVNSEEAINLALQYICLNYDADRCYIFESYDKGFTCSNTFEWARPTVEPQISNMINVGYEFYQEILSAAKNGIINIENVDKLQPNTYVYRMMKEQSIKSMLHFQIEQDNYIPFFLGLDDCHKSRKWTEKEIITLRYITKVVFMCLQSKKLLSEVEALTDYNQISAYISDSSEDIVYLSDIENYNILYLNRAALTILGNPPESEWKNQKCYQLLQGKSAPCEFCTNHLINDKEFYEWTYLNKIFNKTYLLKDKLIPMRGKLVRLESATDISQVISLEEELKAKLAEERMILSCIETLHAGKDPQTSINDLLKIVANYHDAERSYIFEEDENAPVINNTYEWCAEGISAQLNNLQGIPLTEVAKWYEHFEKAGEFYIDSVNDDLVIGSFEHEVLSAQQIVSLVAAPLHDENGNLNGFIGIDNPKANIKKTSLMRSVTKFVSNFLDDTKILDELHKLSYYDILTGLKNRHSYRRTLNDLNSMQISSLGVVYADICSLRSLNDAKGTAYGDLMIQNLANYLSDIFGEDCYRVGGDEFVILKYNITEKEFENKINNLKEMLKQEYRFKVSLGFTWNKNLNSQIDDEYTYPHENFDIYGGKYAAILAQNLDQEIANSKFAVYFQPQIDLQTEQIVGAEALIRRIDADGHIQVPLSFVPFYEKEGIISKIDIFVFQTVCQQLNQWQKQGFANKIKLSVNCSRQTVMEKEIVKKFVDIADFYQISKKQIIIEITETISSADDIILSQIISQFAAAGFSVSLDDFGSGYSNLSALKLTDFDELKLDMSLTCNLNSDKKSKILTKVALSLCSELENMVSVAEGIETADQCQTLKEMGCKVGQGYYFDKPMPIEMFCNKYIINMP